MSNVKRHQGHEQREAHVRQEAHLHEQRERHEQHEGPSDQRHDFWKTKNRLKTRSVERKEANPYGYHLGAVNVPTSASNWSNECSCNECSCNEGSCNECSCRLAAMNVPVMNVPFDLRQWMLQMTWSSFDTFTWATWLGHIHMSDMTWTHSHERHDFCKKRTCCSAKGNALSICKILMLADCDSRARAFFSFFCATESSPGSSPSSFDSSCHVCHATLETCESWLIRVSHDSFMCVTRLFHIRVMTHEYACHGSFICVPRRIHMWNTTHS